MIDHLVLVEEPQRSIQPFPAPPLPSEALALTSSGQVAPNLLLYPVSDIREAPAGVADRKVVHPAAQNGIDLLDQPRHRVRATGGRFASGRNHLAFRFDGHRIFASFRHGFTLNLSRFRNNINGLSLSISSNHESESPTG